MEEEARRKDIDDDRREEEETPLADDEVAVQEEIVEPADELTMLRQRLEEEEAKVAEYLDGWQRARAELAKHISGIALSRALRRLGG